MHKYTDKEILDFLQAENNKARFGGKCIMLMSAFRRGWRLHESTSPGAMASIREAIALQMDATRITGQGKG